MSSGVAPVRSLRTCQRMAGSESRSQSTNAWRAVVSGIVVLSVSAGVARPVSWVMPRTLGPIPDVTLPVAVFVLVIVRRYAQQPKMVALIDPAHLAMPAQ